MTFGVEGDIVRKKVLNNISEKIKHSRGVLSTSRLVLSHTTSTSSTFLLNARKVGYVEVSNFIAGQSRR